MSVEIPPRLSAVTVFSPSLSVSSAVSVHPPPPRARSQNPTSLTSQTSPSRRTFPLFAQQRLLGAEKMTTVTTSRLFAPTFNAHRAHGDHKYPVKKLNIIVHGKSGVFQFLDAAGNTIWEGDLGGILLRRPGAKKLIVLSHFDDSIWVCAEFEHSTAANAFRAKLEACKTEMSEAADAMHEEITRQLADTCIKLQELERGRGRATGGHERVRGGGSSK